MRPSVPILLALAAAAACAAPGVVYDPAAPPDPERSDLAATADRASLFLGVETAHELGVSLEAFGEAPPLGRADLQIFSAVLAGRALELERCIPGARGEAVVHPTRWVSVLVDTGGAVRDLRLESSGRARDDAGPLACARTAVATWHVPPPEAPGRVWFRLEGRGPPLEVEALPRGAYRKPRMKRAGCVAKAVRLAPVPRSGSAVVRATVKFAVGPAGQVGAFQVLEPLTLPTAVGREIERAVRACEWVPGSGPDGPMSIWVVLPLRWTP